MKKSLSFLLALLMILSLVSCGTSTSSPSPSADASDEPTTRIFTDSVGREVEVPEKIEKIALSGPMAQIVLFPLCPEMMVGVSNAWSSEAEQYLDPEYFNMPQIGQLYGGKGELNLETLLDSGAQIVIDVGEPKDSIVEDLDALQEQTGLPFVHITATTKTTGNAYRMLGDLLGLEEEAEKLALYCEDRYDRAVAIADSVDKANILYITGSEGHNVIAQGSYHAEIIDLMTNNLALVDAPSSKGTGNEVGMEQILTWDPDVIIFSPDGAYDLVDTDPAWQSLTAIQNGEYYEVPFGPYNWMGFPPSVQRYLGMMWLAKVLYPEAAADYDMFEEAQEYYQLFYHCDLTEEQYNALVANSLGKRS